MALILSAPCFPQFGKISQNPLIGPCPSANILGLDTMANVVYSCGITQTWAPVSSAGGQGNGNVSSTNGLTYQQIPFAASPYDIEDSLLKDQNGTLIYTGNQGFQLAGTGPASIAFGPSSPLASYASCSGTTVNSLVMISDSSTNTLGANISGGGSNDVIGRCNGTNYTVVAGTGAGGSGGGGSAYQVPTAYPTIQAAINAAQAAHDGPVVIKPTYTGTDTYTNTGASGVDVADMRTRFNGQSPAFQPLSIDQKFGTMPDGKFLYGCSVTSGSNAVACTDATFTAADVGKLVVCYGCGTVNGHITVAPTVVSGGTGGRPSTWQEVFFTDGGCTTQPRGSVQLSPTGVPTGAVTLLNGGNGCTSVPTHGQVGTVTGVTTFSGGARGSNNITTKITGFTDSTHITIAIAASVTAGRFFAYGSDNKQALQAFVNSYQGNGSASALQTAWGILNGIYFISGCIDAYRFNGRLSGTGTGSIAGGSGTILVYAGTTANDCILNIRGGLDSRVERIHFFGNSQFQPDALRFTHMTADSGGAINSYHYIDQNVFGSDYTSQGPDWYSGDPNINHGVFATTDIGNADFYYLPINRCNGAATCLETDNGNATEWNVGTWFTTYSGVGFNCAAWCVIGIYASGGNITDLVIGPEVAAQGGTSQGYLRIGDFASESSQQMLRLSRINPPSVWKVDIRRGTFQVGNYIAPADSGYRKVIDFTQGGGWPELSINDFQFGAVQPYYSGPEPWVLGIGTPGGCANTVNTKLTNISGIGPGTVYFPINPICQNGLMGQPFEFSSSNEGGGQNASIKTYPTTQFVTNSFLSDAEIGTIIKTGTVQVSPAGIAGADFLGYGTIGTAGSTDYKYQIVSVDGIYPNQYEGVSARIVDIPTGNATLSATNKNWLGWNNAKGASAYHVYRSTDNGTTWYCLQGTGDNSCHDFSMFDSVYYYAYGYPGMTIYDDGSYGLLQGFLPSVDQTGTLNANHIQLNGANFGMRQLVNWDGSTSAHNEFNFVSDTSGHWGSGLPSTWITGSPPGSNWLPSITAGGATGTWGNNSGTYDSTYIPQTGGIYAYPFQATQNGVINSLTMNYQNVTSPSSAIMMIFDSDGPALPGFSGGYNQAKTLLCNTAAQTVTTGNNTFTMPPGCKVSGGHTYFIAVEDLAQNSPYDSLPYKNGIVPGHMNCRAPANLLGAVPPDMTRVPFYNCFVDTGNNTYPQVWYASYTTLSQPGQLYSVNPSTNHTVCWKSATALGYCSTQPDSTGSCTCN